MNYVKSSNGDEMKSKLATAKNTTTATINSYSTAFYQVTSNDPLPTYLISDTQAHLMVPLINSFMASSVYIIICMTVNR